MSCQTLCQSSLGQIRNSTCSCYNLEEEVISLRILRNVEEKQSLVTQEVYSIPMVMPDNITIIMEDNPDATEEVTENIASTTVQNELDLTTDENEFSMSSMFASSTFHSMSSEISSIPSIESTSLEDTTYSSETSYSSSSTEFYTSSSTGEETTTSESFTIEPGTTTSTTTTTTQYFPGTTVTNIVETTTTVTKKSSTTQK